MIYTVTLNPAIDRAFSFCEIAIGENKKSPVPAVICAGGKGINVSRALSAVGGESVAIFLAGAPSGDEFCALLKKEGVRYFHGKTAAPVRSSIQICEESGRNTVINEPGGPCKKEDLTSVYKFLEKNLKKDDILVLSGSVPKGIDSGIYGEMLLRFRERCGRIVVDAAGEPLLEAVKHKPFIIKPNEEEFSGLAGKKFISLAEMESAAKKMAGKIADIILLTLSEKGAFCVTSEKSVFAPSVSKKAISTVGAGDSFLAGFLHRLERGKDIEDCLKFALAVSAAKVSCPGTVMPDISLVNTFLQE